MGSGRFDGARGWRGRDAVEEEEGWFCGGEGEVSVVGVGVAPAGGGGFLGLRVYCKGSDGWLS